MATYSALKANAITDDSAHDLDLLGFSLAETGGTAAVVVELRDGSATGALLHAPITVAASGLVTAVFPRQVATANAAGVWVAVSGTGTLSGVLYSAL